MRDKLTKGQFFMLVLSMLFFINITVVSASGITKTVGEKMPKFSYQTLEGKSFTQNDLAGNMKYMIVYFNPFCEICQEETEEIIAHISELEGVQIIMVSPVDKDDLQNYIDRYQLSEYSQITVLHDQSDVFYKEFGATGYPNVYLYNEKKELVMYYDMEVSMEEVKEAYALSVMARQKP